MSSTFDAVYHMDVLAALKVSCYVETDMTDAAPSLSLEDIEQRSGIAKPTLRKYQTLGLLPYGRVIRGRGNVAYWNADVLPHLRRLKCLLDFGIPLPTLQRWSRARRQGNIAANPETLAVEACCVILDRAVSSKLTPADLKRLRADLNALFSDLGA